MSKYIKIIDLKLNTYNIEVRAMEGNAGEPKVDVSVDIQVTDRESAHNVVNKFFDELERVSV